MTETLERDIERTQLKLRDIDNTLSTLRPLGRGQAGGGGFGGPRRSFDAYPARTVEGRRITVQNDLMNRSLDSRINKRPADFDDDEFDSRPKRSLQSTVVMPTIETKSRVDKIEEMSKTETKQVTNRNKRMFSNLLMGTLNSFKKNEKKIEDKEKLMTEKLHSVEKRLDDTKREEQEKIIAERQNLMDERRRQEKELKALTRKKALIQYAENKQAHYRLLSNFIQTKSSPVIFFCPAKHTLRSLELLKQSQKKIDALIEMRQKELERDLAANVNGEEVEENGAIRSFVAKDNEEEEEGNEKEEKTTENEDIEDEGKGDKKKGKGDKEGDVSGGDEDLQSDKESDDGSHGDEGGASDAD